MARRNLFQPPPPPESVTAPAPAAETKARFPATGAMSGVKSTLKDVAKNAVREIAVEMIEESGPKDRLSFSDADVEALSQSIKAHGQQVPIMVRPVADRPGHYRIVYGRRRLRALRLLGQPAKALVRSLSDAEAIMAQGQENTQRLDPSFIEKALFAAELADSGYDKDIILDALAVDKPMLSRMTKVARAIPVELIEHIGSAHGVGRRRWEDLADKIMGSGADPQMVLAGMAPDVAKTSEERFGAVYDAIAQALKSRHVAGRVEAPALLITLQDGSPLAEVKETARALTLKLSKTGNPEFARWMYDNAQTELIRLYEAWQSRRKPD